MAPDVAQEIDIIELGEPFGIVGHHGFSLTFAEGHKARENLANSYLVGFDLLDRQQFAAFILARGVADHCRAAAHQRDRLAAALLQPVQQHDLHQRADMKRRRGAVETDIGDQRTRTRFFIQPGEIGTLMNEAALLERRQKIGSRVKGFGQNCGSLARLARGLGTRSLICNKRREAIGLCDGNRR